MNVTCKKAAILKRFSVSGCVIVHAKSFDPWINKKGCLTRFSIRVNPQEVVAHWKLPKGTALTLFQCFSFLHVSYRSWFRLMLKCCLFFFVFCRFVVKACACFCCGCRLCRATQSTSSSACLRVWSRVSLLRSVRGPPERWTLWSTRRWVWLRVSSK